MTYSGCRVLVVDDDLDLLDLIGMRLTSAGYAVTLASSGEEALRAFRAECPRAVISDLRMDGMDGHELFRHLQAEAPTVPVIMLTAHGTIPDAVAATQRGVFSFLTKPFDGHELLARVADAMALSPPLSGTGSEGDWRADFVATSPAMEELLRQAYRLAADDGTILIVGQPGTGKELLARAIHRASGRSAAPFVVLPCGSLGPDQVDAVLFGQARGAGENSAGGGLLGEAAGGSLFVDEIEALPPVAQARLIPLVRRGNGLFDMLHPTGPDVRILAASSGALDRAVQEGEFRADLYYSLAASTLNLPPLSERREDITALIVKRTGSSDTAPRFSPDALKLLHEAPWPGNVRQLLGVVDQALQLSVATMVPASLIARLLHEESGRELTGFDDARRGFERDYLVRLLQATNGNVTRAAQIAQRNRTEFYKLLSRHEIDPSCFKPGTGR